jgi:hypothetical protein
MGSIVSTTAPIFPSREKSAWTQWTHNKVNDFSVDTSVDTEWTRMDTRTSFQRFFSGHRVDTTRLVTNSSRDPLLPKSMHLQGFVRSIEPYIREIVSRD